MSDEAELCCVCIENPPNNTLPCGHKLCSECMGRLHSNECPQCRRPVMPNLQPPENSIHGAEVEEDAQDDPLPDPRDAVLDEMHEAHKLFNEHGAKEFSIIY